MNFSKRDLNSMIKASFGIDAMRDPGMSTAIAFKVFSNEKVYALLEKFWPVLDTYQDDSRLNWIFDPENGEYVFNSIVENDKSGFFANVTEAIARVFYGYVNIIEENEIADADLIDQIQDECMELGISLPSGDNYPGCFITAVSFLEKVFREYHGDPVEGSDDASLKGLEAVLVDKCSTTRIGKSILADYKDAKKSAKFTPYDMLFLMLIKAGIIGAEW